MAVKKDPWPEGTPAWVDLMVPDLEAAKSFYAGVFGWEYEQSDEQYGNYATAHLDGDAVAGIGPAQGPDAPPPVWTTYLAADDAGAVADKVTEAGGNVLVPPMEVGSFGSMAVVTDSTGAVFGLWQSGENTGVDRVDEPGALTWNEVMVGDYQSGMDFYTKVFGFTYKDIGGGFDYSTVELNGQPVAGVGTAAMVGDGVPPHWRTYFSVADAAETCAKVTEFGGAVVAEPWETPFGLMAELTGPAGEVFLINQPPADPPAAPPE